MSAYPNFTEKPLQISYTKCGQMLNVVVYLEPKRNSVEKYTLQVSSVSLTPEEIIEDLRKYFEKRLYEK